MWRTLTNLADAELDKNAEAAKQSYEKLAKATWELQKHVKELLCDYPETVVEEPATAPAEEPLDKEGEAMGHAARLLGSLCTQPARGDVTCAPGAIYTPKGDARERGPTDAGPSVLEGASALRAFLSADVPSMRWDAAVGPGAEAGPRQRQLHSAPTRGPLGGQRATPKLLRVRLDTTTEADAQGLPQRQSDDLRAWAVAALRGLHPDVSLEDVHGALLLGAVQGGSVSALEGASWFRTYGDVDVAARSRQLLAGVFHTSRSSQEAWAGVTQAFSHGLVQPDGEAARLMGLRSEETVSGTRVFDVTPESYQSYIKDMRDKMDELVAERLRAGWQDGSSPRAGGSLSEKDAAACRLSITPRSYLQVVGQKLLHHAARQLPCMAELPERIPDWTLRNLYGRPFAEAVRLALQHGMASINESLGPGGEGADERVRGSKLAQSLLRSSVGPKDNNPKRAEPRQPQQPCRDRPEDSAKPRFSFSGGGIFGQRAAASDQTCLNSGGASAAAATAAVVKVEVWQRALSRARRAVELLADTQRDMEGFEAGFAAILRGDTHGPSRPTSEGMPAQTQEPHALVSPHSAAAYLLVIREEFGQAFREMAPTLRALLYDSITSAVQACLAGDDLQQPPRPVPVSADCWPLLEARLHGPREAPPSRSSSLGSSPRGSSAAAPAQAWSDASAFIRSTDGDAVVRPEADRNAPPAVDALSHRVLELVSWLAGCMGQLPEPLQPVLLSAVLECMALLMDRLSLVCAALGDMPAGGGGGTGRGGGGSGPLTLALLFHSAACCVRRRLEALQPGEGLGCSATAVAAGRQPRDGQLEVDLARQHGEALMQADELVTHIQQHIVMSYMQVMYDVVLSSLDRTDWCAFRPEVMRGQVAGPAVRVWHSMLLRLLYTAAIYTSPHAAEGIVGQVLLESAGCLVRRYLRIGPTVQMLREYVADAVHLAASVFLMAARPVAVSVRMQRGRRAEGCVGGREPRQQQQQRQDSATDAAPSDTLWLRMPFPVARALSELVRQLLTRAALLHIPGSQLEQVARRVGLATATAATAAARAAAETESAPAAPAAEQSAPNSRGGTTDGTSSGSRLAPLPAIRAQRSVAPTMEGVPAGPGLGQRALVVVASAGTCASPTAGTFAEDSGHRSLSAAGDAVLVAAKPAGEHPPAGPASTCPLARGIACTGSGGDAHVAATDEERLELWASWLPGDVVRALMDPAEVIALGGAAGGHSGPVAQELLIPLGDRMAEAGRTTTSNQKRPKADGRMWRSCLEQLAQRASSEELVLALARRHELHAAVGTEPPGNAESRMAVRTLARVLGLLPTEAADE